MQPENNVQGANFGTGTTPGLSNTVSGMSTTTPMASKKENLFKDTPKKNNGMLIGLVLCVIAAVAGIGFGVWSGITSAEKEKVLNAEIETLKGQVKSLMDKDDDEVIEDGDGSNTGFFYGKPASVDDVDSIHILYNGGRDYIQIVASDYYETEGGRIDYYAYDENGNYVNDDVTEVYTDTSDIISYIYDNSISNCNDETSLNSKLDWHIEIYGPGMGCSVGGNGAEPDWVVAILDRLDVKNKGYLSRTIMNE